MLGALQFDVSPIGPVPLATLPRLPSGQELAIETRGLVGRESVGLGGRLWPSAAAMCRWLRSSGVQGQHVLELGCGTGAVGLYAAALGASSVTLTDGGSESLLNMVQANVERNRALVDLTRIKIAQFEWGCATDFSVLCFVWCSNTVCHSSSSQPSFGMV